jgi:hypothetical protein
VWDLIEQDLHQYFGIDVGDPDLLANRSWRWLRTRIVGCLGVYRGRTAQHFAPPERQPRTKK